MPYRDGMKCFDLCVALCRGATCTWTRICARLAPRLTAGTAGASARQLAISPSPTRALRCLCLEIMHAMILDAMSDGDDIDICSLNIQCSMI